MKTNAATLILCILIASFTVTILPSEASSENTKTPTGTLQPLTYPDPPVYGNWTYSGKNNGSVSCYSLAPSRDGGYVLAGQNFNIPITCFDGWLLKVDATGTVQWNKTYAGPTYGAECIYSIVNCSDGGYVFTGYTSSYGAGGDDMWLVKVDENGTQEWMHTYGGTSQDGGMSVIATSDDGYMVVGFTNCSVTEYDIFIVKTDSTGNLVWSKTFGGLGWDIAYDVVETADSGYAIVGYTNPSEQEGFLLRLDSDGNQLWNKTYGAAYPASFRSIKKTSTGFTVLGGISPDYNHSSCWLVNVDINGDLLWNKTYGGNYYTAANGFIMTSDGGYVFTGITNAVNVGYPDLWLVKVDSEGNQQWNRTYGDTGYDIGYAIIPTDNGYALAGQTDSYGYLNKKFWLILTDNYGRINYRLTTLTVGQGTVSPGNQTYPIGNNTKTDLVAIPAEGWCFSGWSGDALGIVNTTITMNNDKNITATFLRTRSLTMITIGQGSVSPGNQSYPDRTVVNLNATAEPGYSFSGWSGALTSASQMTSIEITADFTVTATFTKDSTASNSGSSGSSSSGSSSSSHSSSGSSSNSPTSTPTAPELSTATVLSILALSLIGTVIVKTRKNRPIEKHSINKI